MKTIMSRSFASIVLLAAFLIVALAMLLPVRAVGVAGPDCYTELVTNQEGQLCLICVVGGSMSACECGGMVCHT